MLPLACILQLAWDFEHFRHLQGTRIRSCRGLHPAASPIEQPAARHGRVHALQASAMQHIRNAHPNRVSDGSGGSRTPSRSKTSLKAISETMNGGGIFCKHSATGHQECESPCLSHSWECSPAFERVAHALYVHLKLK